jgi:hypothetical protein
MWRLDKKGPFFPYPKMGPKVASSLKHKEKAKKKRKRRLEA